MPKILAVDDSATMRQVIELTFRGLDGFEVKTFDSADQALQHAESSGADLILADASMSPDGYDLCKRVKAGGATSAIPVIILASQQTPFDADKAKAAGADDHALKPYDTNTFIDKVRAVIATAKKQPAPAAMGATYRQAPVTLGGATPGPTAAAVGSPIAATKPSTAPVAPSPIPGVLGVAAPKTQQRMTATFGAPLPAAIPNQAKRPVLELSEEDEPPTPTQPAPIRPPTAAPIPVAPPAPIVPAVVAPPPPVAPVAPPVAAPIAAAAKAATPQMTAKLEGMGLTADQIQGVLGLTREVIERVVWEVVPDLAETIIREELKRLTK